MEQNNNNLISLSNFRSSKHPVKSPTPINRPLAQPSQKASTSDQEDQFLALMKKNDEAKRKRAEERAKSNISVLKSYKIKN